MAINSAVQARAWRRHLCSYLLISILPILICGLLITYNSYVRHTERADNQALEGLTLYNRTYASILSGMDACAGHLEDYIASTYPSGKEQLSHQLASYRKNYNIFSDVLYYEKGSAYIYTTEGLQEYANFEKDFALATGVDPTMTTLFSTMNRATANSALQSRALDNFHEDGEYICYIYAIPRLDAKPQGAMVFFVSTQNMLALLKDCVPENWAGYAYSDQYLTRLFHSDADLYQNLWNALDRLGSASMAHETIDGKSYLLLKSRSDRDDMVHMLAYETNALYAPYRADAVHSACLLLLLLLPVTVVALVLHRREYLPIKELLNLPLPDSGTKPTRADTNALLGIVSQRAQTMIAQNEALQEQLEDKKTELQAQYVMNLLYHGEDGRLAADVPAFAYPMFTAICAVVVPGSDGLLRQGSMWMQSTVQCDLYILPLRETHLFGILCNHAQMDRSELASIAVAQADSLGIHIKRCGVGISQRQMDRTPISFVQAQAAMREDFGVGGVMEQISLFYTEEDTRAGSKLLPISEKLLLCQCIRSGNRELALSTLHKMQSDILLFSGSNAILHNWNFFLYESVVEVLRETHLEELAASLPLEDVLCARQDEFLLHIERIIERACTQISRLEERQVAQKQADLLNYVQAHFRDFDISLSLLSEKFGYSESYITKFFRQTLGEGFLQYVSDLRMDWVKEQLVSTDRPVKDIVLDVGYADAANFTRKFRQIEGITPGQYRARHRMDHMGNSAING